GHRVDAAEHAAGDEQTPQDAQHDHDRDRPSPRRDNDSLEPLTLFEIAADEEAESPGQLEDADQGIVRAVVGLFEAPIRGFIPAGRIENAGRQRRNIAGEGIAVEGRDQIEARTRAPRPRIDYIDQASDAAEPVLL